MAVEKKVPYEFPHRKINGALDDNSAFKPLLENRDYDRLARVLKQDVPQSSESPIASSLILAARQLCQVCIDCQEQKAHFQQLQEAAVAHEKEMRQNLLAMLILLEKAAENQVLERSVTGLDSQTSESEKDDVQPGIWHRIQGILGLKPVDIPETEQPPVFVTDDAIKPDPGDTPPLTISYIPEEYDALVKDDKEDPPATPEFESVVDENRDKIHPSLMVYCLGLFQAYLDDNLVESWPSGKGKAIFKYLITHREFPTAKEVLMELFWPGADPDAARNNLNVAIYGLRQALRSANPGFSHILFQDDAYLINPELEVWVDVEEFEERYRVAQKLEQESNLDKAIRDYIAAEALYQHEFIAEDRYDDWILSRRQQLKTIYLNLLERLSRFHFKVGDFPSCISICQKMLTVDSCREDTHRLLMRCYKRQDQRYLALRQFHLCAEYLREELDISPAPETIALYDQIKR